MTYAKERRLLADAVVQMISLSLTQDLDSTTKESIGQRIYCILEQTEERCKIFFRDQIDGGESLNKMMEQSAHVEDFLYQCFRQRNIQLNTPWEYVTDMDTQIHVAAIRKHSSLLRENIKLEGNVLLDTLIEKDVLSDAGRQSILCHKTESERNVAFLSYMSKEFTTESFRSVMLPALQVDHPALAEELQREMDSKAPVFLPIKHCQSCEAKSKINLRKLASELHQMGMISEALYLDLVSKDITQSAKWQELYICTKKKPNVVMVALKRYNPGLFEWLKRSKQHLLICTCDQVSTDVGSLVARSDITDTGENEDEEADVARMSDFSSEVNSPLSVVNSEVDSETITRKQRLVIPKLLTAGKEGSDENRFLDAEKGTESSDRVRGSDETMKAPLPPVKRDHPFTSTKPATQSIGKGDGKFECFTSTKDVLDMEAMLARKGKELKILKHKVKKLKKRTIKLAILKLHGLQASRKFGERRGNWSTWLT